MRNCQWYIKFVKELNIFALLIKFYALKIPTSHEIDISVSSLQRPNTNVGVPNCNANLVYELYLGLYDKQPTSLYLLIEIDSKDCQTNPKIVLPPITANYNQIENVPHQNQILMVNLYTEEAFHTVTLEGLYNPEKASYLSFKIPRNSNIAKLIEKISKTINCPKDQFKLWPFKYSGQAYRPMHLDTYRKDAAFNLEDTFWDIFVEMLPKKTIKAQLPPFDLKHDVIIFFKYYDSKCRVLRYFGHIYLAKYMDVSELIRMLNELAGYSSDTKLNLYKEIKSKTVYKCALSGSLTQVYTITFKIFEITHVLRCRQ